MTEEEKIDRGKQAAALLAHPLIKEALNDIADRCLRGFADTDPEDTQGLSRHRRMLETAARFHEFFKRVVTEGHNAAVKAEMEPKEIV